MIKSEQFSKELQELAKFAKVLSHPARLSILQYLAETRVCISGDISDSLPLSRSTVSQHLTELKEMGLIQGQIEGLKVNYCLCPEVIRKYADDLSSFFDMINTTDICCKK